MANFPRVDHAMMSSSVLFIANQIAAQVTANTTGGQSSALAGGYYDIWAAQDVSVQVAANALVGISATNNYLVRANQTVTLYVPEQMKIGAQAVSTNTTLNLIRVG